MSDDLNRLILYLEDELAPAEREALERRLAVEPELAETMEGLKHTVAIVTQASPDEPEDEYFNSFYSRLSPKLQPKESFWEKLTRPLRPLGRLGYSGGLAAMVLAFFLVAVGINTFLLKRHEPQRVRNETVNIKRSEKFFDYVAAKHLAKSELLLREVYNISQAGPYDDETLVEAQRRGNYLLSANRSYRQAAEARGDEELAKILEDLEVVLIEISNLDPSAAEYALPSLKRAIRKKNLLIKIEIINLNDLEAPASSNSQEVV